MPVTLILKSSKRPSWLCSRTGTKTSPFSPPWNRSGGASRPPPRWESGVSGPVAATARPHHAWRSSPAAKVPTEGGQGSHGPLATRRHHRDPTGDGRPFHAAGATLPRPAHLSHSLCRGCTGSRLMGAGLRGVRSPVRGLFLLLQAVI